MVPAASVPRELSGGPGARGEPQCLDNGIVEQRAHLPDLLIGPRWVHPVRKQYDEEISIRVDPKRRSSEARVAKAFRRKVAARRRPLRRHVPSKRSRRVTNRFPRGELRSEE